MDKNFGSQLVSMIQNNVKTSFQHLSLIQEQNEKFAKMLAEQAELAQKNGKEFFDTFVENVKKNQDEFQKNVLNELEKLQNMVKPGE